MDTVAFVTANSSLKDDFDMPELLAACRAGGLAAEVCAWDDRSIDWSRYQAVVLRSPWDYSEHLAQFLAWGEQVTGVTKLFNPLSAVKWSLDKHYLLDLANFGVPVVPSEFVEPGAPAEPVLRAFLTEHTHVEDFVVKPAIGCYSKGVPTLQTWAGRQGGGLCCLSSRRWLQRNIAALSFVDRSEW